MSKSILNYNVIFLTVCAVLLSSCSLQASTPEQAITLTSTTAPLPITTTASPSPEPTLVPTDTPFPSPTPIPWTSKPITAENAKEIKEINHWGRGTPLGIQKLKRGDDQLLVLTSLGVYFYQTKAPYVLASFPDADQGYLSQDEKLLAVGLKNGDVQIWNVDDLSLKQTLTHIFPEDIVKKIKEEQLIPFYVGGMAFSPDNSEIAVGYADGTIDLFRIGENKPYVTLRHNSFSLWQTDIGLIFHLSYSPDGKTLVVFKYAPSISANRLTFWSLPEGKLISVSEAAQFYDFTDPAYLHDDQTLLVSSRKDSYLYLTLWNVQTGKKLNSFPTGLAEIISTEIAQDGKQATIYGSDVQQTYYRRVWKLPDGKLLENEKLDKHPDQDYYTRINDFLFEQGHYYNSWNDKNGPKFAQVGALGNQAFRVRVQSHLLTFPEGSSESVDLPKDASNAYYDPQEQTVGWCPKGILNIQDKNGKLTTVEVPAILSCDGVTISPKRDYAAVWKGNSLYLVSLETGEVHDMKSHEDQIYAARFTSDETSLVSGGFAEFIAWGMDPLHKRARQYPSTIPGCPNIKKIVISRDDTFAVTLRSSNYDVADSQIMIWRIEDALILRRINPPVIGGVQPKLLSFALSPDDRLIASGDDFSRISIWSVKNGEILASFDIDSRPLDLVFTPDGSGLIIVVDDGTIRLWGVP